MIQPYVISALRWLTVSRFRYVGSVLLGVLYDEGLLQTRREGKYIHDTLARADLVQPMQALHQVF